MGVRSVYNGIFRVQDVKDGNKEEVLCVSMVESERVTVNVEIWAMYIFLQDLYFLNISQNIYNLNTTFIII